MFSYIYADGRNGVSYVIGCKTKSGIERMALDYITNMISGEGYIKDLKPGPPQEVQDIFNALDSKDVDKAIETWNTFATIYLKQHIACHKIEPMKIVE